jgi:hypothetical protein
VPDYVLEIESYEDAARRRVEPIDDEANETMSITSQASKIGLPL